MLLWNLVELMSALKCVGESWTEEEKVKRGGETERVMWSWRNRVFQEDGDVVLISSDESSPPLIQATEQTASVH